MSATGRNSSVADILIFIIMETEKAYEAARILRKLEELNYAKQEIIYNFKTSNLKSEKEIIRFLKYLNEKGLKEVFENCIFGVVDYLEGEIDNLRMKLDEL